MRLTFATFAAIAFATAAAHAQCPGEWHPSDGFPGVANGAVFSSLRHSDGLLIVGGNFRSAGKINALAIARWDGAAWSPLGAGLASGFPPAGSPGEVLDILELPGGDVVVSGFFAFAGGTAANNLARWDGASWSPLGGGVTGGGVYGLTRAPNGDLIAGGTFTHAGGQPINRFARWDGSHPLLTGFDREVLALAVEPDGTLAIGGRFRSRNAEPAAFFFRWTPPFNNCPANFNCDAAVNSQDFFDFLGAFFSNDPAADFNEDDAINSQDFFDFLAHFFEGC